MSISWGCVGRRYQCIMCEYDFTTVIVIRQVIQPRKCERDSLIFVAITRLKFMRMNSASLPIMPSTEKENRGNFSVVCDISYPVYLYFPSPNKRGDFPLVTSCRFLRPSLQIWRQLWIQYGFTIIPEWGCHLVSQIRTHADILPPLIWCGPGGWGVHRIHS